MRKISYNMFKILGIVLVLLPSIGGHGIMVDPLQRSSLWREYGTENFQANYNDNELFCGGVHTQWNVNNGACGICGDPFNAEVKDNEAGGKYATGFTAKTYSKGQQIEIKVNLTAAHAGYFEFRICPHNDIYTPVSQDCLDKNLLKIAGTGETQYEPGFQNGQHKIYLQLPEGLTCDQCVFQWHYRAGNTWACDKDGNCCSGCGPQETFRNCADVKIV